MKSKKSSTIPLSFRLETKANDHILKLCKKSGIKKSTILHHLILKGLDHADPVFFDDLKTSLQKEERRKQLHERSNRIKYLNYFLQNAMKTILISSRVQYACDQSVNMKGIKALIKVSEEMYEDLDPEEQEIVFFQLEILRQYSNESKVLDVVHNIARQRLIKK